MIDRDRHHCFDSAGQRVNQFTSELCGAFCQLRTIGFDDGAVPPRGILQGASLRLVVHMDQSKSLGVPLAPFEIVHDGPVEIPIHFGSIRDGFFQLQQIPPGESILSIADAPSRPTQSIEAIRSR